MVYMLTNDTSSYNARAPDPSVPTDQCPNGTSLWEVIAGIADVRGHSVLTLGVVRQVGVRGRNGSPTATYM